MDFGYRLNEMSLTNMGTQLILVAQGLSEAVVLLLYPIYRLWVILTVIRDIVPQNKFLKKHFYIYQ